VAGYPNGDAEYLAWERGLIRSRGKYLGTEKSPLTGAECEVYGFLDEDFDGTRLTFDEDRPRGPVRKDYEW
jgi:hypothetical protein